MSGIFGLLSGNKIKFNKLLDVSQVISHRGPDDAGILLFNTKNSKFHKLKLEDKFSSSGIESTEFNGAFVHRNLFLVDKSKACHQPLSNNSDYLWIVFDGEIFNYKDLISELIENGQILNSQSDVEVILAAYSFWGLECVNKFNGNWAFAIWDSKKKLLFLSRDRLGIKPLYYLYDNHNFIFCSEIKGIREYIEQDLKIDNDRIIEYLIRAQIFVGETEDSIFKGIKQLSPGSNLIFSNNKIQLRKYWNLNLTKNNSSFSENVEGFLKLFHQSVQSQLGADVEVGSCLSGGIDSSSLVSFSSEMFNIRLRTFSAVWPEENCNEAHFIEKVNKKNNCISNTFTPNLENILELIDKEIWHQEIPFSGGSLLAQWCVMEKAKAANIKVLLDGQGADEVLAGYPFYLTAYVNEMVFSLKWNELVKYYSLLKKNGYTFKWFLNNQRYRFISPIRRARLPIKRKLFKENKLNTEHHNGYACNKLNEFVKSQIELTVLPMLLHYADRNSMAHSVQSRLPFLDHRLVEFTVNIPAEQKIRGTLTKVILREAMKNYLPEEIYNRTDKIGFSTPIEKKLFYKGSQLFEYCLDSLHNSDIYKTGWLEPDEINSNNIFGLYSLSRFLKIWG